MPVKTDTTADIATDTTAQFTAPLPTTLVQTPAPAATAIATGPADPLQATPAPVRAGTTAPAPQAERKVFAPTVLPRDEFTGKGGDYVIGPDGTRQPATAVPPAAD